MMKQINKQTNGSIHGSIHTTFATPSRDIPLKMPRVTCIFSTYSRASRRASKTRFEEEAKGNLEMAYLPSSMADLIPCDHIVQRASTMQSVLRTRSA